jgi:hypothetical protein
MCASFWCCIRGLFQQSLTSPFIGIIKELLKINVLKVIHVKFLSISWKYVLSENLDVLIPEFP